MLEGVTAHAELVGSALFVREGVTAHAELVGSALFVREGVTAHAETDGSTEFVGDGVTAHAETDGSTEFVGDADKLDLRETDGAAVPDGVLETVMSGVHALGVGVRECEG